MKSMRQSFYPKHQVLVLKCYPDTKFLKTNADVKPNSSELSYLLYYASTRRSKLQKVGDFLDHKTATDLRRGRAGNIQVTLQIFAALVEKCPRDLPLFAPAVLRALRTVLHSNDITLVEFSLPTFETFCAHQNASNLAADQDYINLFVELVRLYAAFASKDDPIKTKHPVSVPVALRYRKAGLQAIKSVASSDSLASGTEKQLLLIIPVILQNVFSEDGAYLRALRRREISNEEVEKELGHRRRQSMSTVRTSDTAEADPLAASGSIEDADKLAEEEVGGLAMQSLRSIFMAVNRAQLRSATLIALEFVTGRVPPGYSHSRQESSSAYWSMSLLEAICEWAPVQDRFIILFTAVETLSRISHADVNLEKQLLLASSVDWLLCSSINFIGLSVMDVLVLITQTIFHLLRIGSSASNGGPQPVQGDTHIEKTAPPGSTHHSSAIRMQLVDQLQRCVADLATHIYYTDQVSDMVFTVLQKVKPASHSIANSTSSVVQDFARSSAEAAALQEKQHVDKPPSIDAAKLAVLSAVKQILHVANSQVPNRNSGTINRNKVSISVWEGTECFLRDPNEAVRIAYVDALLTWLKLEIKREDMLIANDQPSRPRTSKNGDDAQKGNSLARRAVSNAIQVEKPVKKRSQSMFLRQLCLVIYDSIILSPESVLDILLLHLLLVNLVDKLGINGVRPSLPMIMRLQEDIQAIESPKAKINVGSLVHGYLWALAVSFEFEPSAVGQEIQSEIDRRKSHGLWLDHVTVPPLPLKKIASSATLPSPTSLSPQLVQWEALKPFDQREKLVDRLADAYRTFLIPPPSSPPRSPERSQPISGFGHAIALPSPPKVSPPFPVTAKEELLSDWSKETCIAATTKSSSRSVSLNGSRAGTGSTARNLLTVSIPAAAMSGTFIADGMGSPLRAFSPVRRGRPASAAPYNQSGRSDSMPSYRRGSAHDSPSQMSSSSLHSAVRVEDLKRILSGGAMSCALRTTRHERRHMHDDTASESMMSADFSVSEMSFVQVGSSEPVDHNGVAAAVTTEQDKREESVTPRPSSRQFDAASLKEQNFSRPATATGQDGDGVPPVPPLPAALQLIPPTPADDDPNPPSMTAVVVPDGGSLSEGSGVRKSRSLRRRHHAHSARTNGLHQLNDGIVRDGAADGSIKPDFSQLLDDIDADGDQDRTVGAVHGMKPPY